MSGSLLVATSVEDAVRELADGARVVAGGTDLVVGARQGKAPLPNGWWRSTACRSFVTCARRTECFVPGRSPRTPNSRRTRPSEAA